MNHLFKIARDVSYRSVMEYRLGALIIKNGKVLGKGYNNNTRTYINGNIYPGVHAEHSAIRDYTSKKHKGNKVKRRREKGGYDSSSLHKG
jgi:pyrimidine deaminase RibD-like protein